MQRARTVGGAVAACAQPNCRHGLPRRSRIVEGNELLLPQCTAGEKGRRQHIERGAHCLVYLLRRAGERGRGTPVRVIRSGEGQGKRVDQVKASNLSCSGASAVYNRATPPGRPAAPCRGGWPPGGGGGGRARVLDNVLKGQAISPPGPPRAVPFCHTQHGPQPSPHSGRPPCWHSG